MNEQAQSEPNRIEPLPFGDSPKDGGIPGGCGKGAVIGCGVLLLLLGIGAVIFAFNAPKVLTWAWDAVHPEVERRLSEDLSAAERASFSPTYEEFKKAVLEGDMDPEVLTEVQTLMMKAIQQEQPLTAAESRRLIEAMGSIRLSEKEAEGGGGDEDGEGAGEGETPSSD